MPPAVTTVSPLKLGAAVGVPPAVTAVLPLKLGAAVGVPSAVTTVSPLKLGAAVGVPPPLTTVSPLKLGAAVGVPPPLTTVSPLKLGAAVGVPTALDVEVEPTSAPSFSLSKVQTRLASLQQSPNSLQRLSHQHPQLVRPLQLSLQVHSLENEETFI